MRLIPPLTDAERVGFIASTRSMVGTRFKHRGRSPQGVDCVGLVALGLASVGREVQDRADYSRNPVNDGLREVCRAHFGDPVDELQAGDVVLMAWYDDLRNPEPNHVAIAFDHPNGGLALVHALRQNQRVIAHGLTDFHAERIVEVYRP